MVSTVYSCGLSGLDGFLVSAECFYMKTLPSIDIIGLPDTAVKESLERVKSALVTAGLPLASGKIVINLAPADKKKEGSSYDLAILLSLLKLSVLENVRLEDSCFVGELSLTGALRPARGVLSMCITARNEGKKAIFVPEANAREASVVDGIEVYPVDNISTLVSHLLGEKKIKRVVFEQKEISEELPAGIDFSDIKGQIRAKRAMEVAAAGGHNILLIGPPGSGKSMLSKALTGILPSMTFEEMLETTKIHSVSGILESGEALVRRRPFRAPHHTLSSAGLIGGGTVPMPGEISLCHNGVLFLDELPEYDKRSLEALRQPLENKEITITRAQSKLTYPSSFMLVCAMNPCPCGYYGSKQRDCKCSKSAISKYLTKISGPLLDRLDIQIEVPALSFEELRGNKSGETSKEVRERVNQARKIALERYKGTDITCNAEATGHYTNEFCKTDEKGATVLKNAFEKLGLSARGYDRVLRVARTIADLDGSEDISEDHILEAVQLRSLDRKYFS